MGRLRFKTPVHDCRHQDQGEGDSQQGTSIPERRNAAVCAFSILGLATLGLAVMPNMLMVSEAEAQTSTTTPPVPQTGTERRQQRRTERTQRRAERRTARQTERTDPTVDPVVSTGNGTRSCVSMVRQYGALPCGCNPHATAALLGYSPTLLGCGGFN